MKKTRLLLMALCIGAITSFTACSGGETKEESTTTDSATYQDNVVPPVTDTTSTMTDTSAMKDTTKP